MFLSENTINWSGFPVQITLTRYGYSTGCKIKLLLYHFIQKKKKKKLSYSTNTVFPLENTVVWYNNNPVSGFPVQITLTKYGYSTGCKIKTKLSYSTNMVFLSENTVTQSGFPVQITLTRYGYSTGYKIKILFIIQY